MEIDDFLTRCRDQGVVGYAGDDKDDRAIAGVVLDLGLNPVDALRLSRGIAIALDEDDSLRGTAFGDLLSQGALSNVSQVADGLPDAYDDRVAQLGGQVDAMNAVVHWIYGTE